MPAANYKDRIAPELRHIAINMPFSAGFARAACPLLYAAERLSLPPRGTRRTRTDVLGRSGNKIPVELYEPANSQSSLPCLLYLHGGAFAYRAAPYHRRLAGEYARRAECRVIVPDYRLSPRYPFPAGYEDVLDVYCWAVRTAEATGSIPRIAVGGDSAGGALAACLCGSAEAQSILPPCFMLLIYPVTDARMETASMKEFPDTPLWNAVSNRKMWEAYLFGAGTGDIRNASPMQAELSRATDAYIETAEFDCLHDEGALYAERLKAAGARVELCETRGTMHGYDVVKNSAITQKSIEKRTDALKRAFAAKG